MCMIIVTQLYYHKFTLATWLAQDQAIKLPRYQYIQLYYNPYHTTGQRIPQLGTKFTATDVL